MLICLPVQKTSSARTAHRFLSGALQACAASHTTLHQPFLQALDTSPSSYSMIPPGCSSDISQLKAPWEDCMQEMVHFGFPCSRATKARILTPHAQGSDLSFMPLCTTGPGSQSESIPSQEQNQHDWYVWALVSSNRAAGKSPKACCQHTSGEEEI